MNDPRARAVEVTCPAESVKGGQCVRPVGHPPPHVEIDGWDVDAKGPKTRFATFEDLN